MQAFVVKRDGTKEPVILSEIQKRVQSLSEDLHIDSLRVAQRVVQGVTDGIHTKMLDTLASGVAAALSSLHPDYSVLAGRIAVSNLHKMTSNSFEVILPYLEDSVREFASKHLLTIDKAIVWEQDLKSLDIFGFRTLEKSYLLRDAEKNVVERPQAMYMRVALGIHCGDLPAVLETYVGMSQGLFTHATPTMFNAGTKHPHLASCFLYPILDDSIEGIFETLKTFALISKSAGGIGFSCSNIRAAGSAIKSTGGTSSGLLPMLRVFCESARYVDQGGGKRKGAFAAYLEPWHADVRVFLEMKKNHGAEELRARDLYYALWIPDLFMRRVQENATWSLLCPSKCPDLVDLYGEAFDKQYEHYEGIPDCVVATMKAQDLWFSILDSQIETGTPYMLYKDACNHKSNQKNLGTIRSSNLCTEIIQYSSVDEIAVCNLASIALPKFVDTHETPHHFDHHKLYSIAYRVAQNLNRVIDRNAYAHVQAQNSNMRHRPVGIGVQGLADAFLMLGMPFDSEEARVLNREIFETIYFASLTASCDLAKIDGPYSSYAGSPMSQGQLQFDMWEAEGASIVLSGRWDWNALRGDIAKHGVRNSLLVAPMPTASTAQILGNNECFEPYTSNIYVRRVLSGEFTIVNKHLIKELQTLGLWNEQIRMQIVAANGSVQNVDAIPQRLKELFKTAWELKQRVLIDMAADRAPFVDQSQSLNLFVRDPDHSKLTSMHFYAWKKGLKTGMYYLRTRAAADAIKVTVPVKNNTVASPQDQKNTAEERVAACRRDDPEGCLLCSS